MQCECTKHSKNGHVYLDMCQTSASDFYVHPAAAMHYNTLNLV